MLQRLFRSAPFRWVAFVLFLSNLGSVIFAQDTKADPAPTTKPVIPYVVLDSVVTQQWPNTLDLVNAPANITILNPGQCIRVAVIADGKNVGQFLRSGKIAWNVSAPFAQSFPPAAPSAWKTVKPEGFDFVLGAVKAVNLAKADVDRIREMPSTSISASKDTWCVPVSATDGDVTVAVSFDINGSVTNLSPAKLHIESIAKSAERKFKDVKALGDAMTGYYAHPLPGELLPMMNAVFEDKMTPAPAVLEFFYAAMRQYSSTAQAFGPVLAKEPLPAKLLAMNLANHAGVTFLSAPTLTDEQRKIVAEDPQLPDPYDWKLDRDLFGKFDMLLSQFGATGQRKPLEKLVQCLAWRTDYDAFVETQKSGKKPDAMTESIVRALGYQVGGWALRSFQTSQPLAADYLEAIAADPRTPVSIRKELTQLAVNPAFNRKK